MDFLVPAPRLAIGIGEVSILLFGEKQAVWDGGEFLGWACLSTGVMTNCQASTTECYVDICFAAPDELLDPAGDVLAIVSACAPGTILADVWSGISDAGRARADVLDLVTSWGSQSPVP